MAGRALTAGVHAAAAVTPGRVRAVRRDAVANRQRLLAAAVTTVLRDGRDVPMSAIAAEAGVGVATLYRAYANRDELLRALTEQSFELLADIAEQVRAGGLTGVDSLDRWWDKVIGVHDRLVLPLSGGPADFTDRALAARGRLHASLRAMLVAGVADGTLRDDVTLRDVIHFGAMLVAALPGVADWGATARRQKRIYLRGLTVSAAAPGRDDR